jgi:hypothetical protein
MYPAASASRFLMYLLKSPHAFFLRLGRLATFLRFVLVRADFDDTALPKGLDERLKLSPNRP